MLIENSLDQTSVVNPDFTLRYVSPSVKRMLGYTQEEFTAFMPPDVIHPDDTEGMMNEMIVAAANPGVNPVGHTGSACSLTASKRQRKVMSAKR